MFRDNRWSRSRTCAVASTGALLALVAGAAAAPAQAAPVAAEPLAVECPAPVPRGSVAAGMVGEGLTVVRGSTPERFSVEVLGVLANGIGAGRDMVMIKVSDLPGGHVVDQGGGIWAGMSGSPVYVDGQLLGAVAYGFTSSPSPIGGLTPAADMLDLLGLSGRPAVAAERSARTAPQVELPSTTRRSLAAKAGTVAPRGSLERLPTPLAVSGLAPQRVKRFQSEADAAGLDVRAYAAGRVSATAVAGPPAARPQAGGNFAAALATGDLSAAGIGTTTAVCGNQAVAFGHPLNLAGPSTYAAADADALAIVKDDAFGAFKLANLGASFGTVDQDRTAGIRADLTATPDTATVSTVIRNLDSGKIRTGVTQVADRASLPGLLPYAVFANQDAVFDEWGDGTATSDWTISGTRAGGRPFSVSRSNAWASRGDVTIDPAVDVAIAADALANNDFEDVTIDDVSFSSDMATRFQQSHISKLEVSVNGGRYTTKRVSVKVGAKLKIRVSLRPYRGTTVTTSTLSMTVPKSARGRSGLLSVDGGMELGQDVDELDEGCLLEGEGCVDPDQSSLDSLIKAIESAPRNDAVVASLLVESDDPEGDGEPVVAASSSKVQKLTVTGGRALEVSVRR